MGPEQVLTYLVRVDQELMEIKISKTKASPSSTVYHHALGTLSFGGDGGSKSFTGGYSQNIQTLAIKVVNNLRNSNITFKSMSKSLG